MKKNYIYQENYDEQYFGFYDGITAEMTDDEEVFALYFWED